MSIALTAIKFFTTMAESHKEEALRQAGEDREKLKQVAAINEISAKLKEIDERFDRMTDEEVKKEIEAQGDFRD